LLFVSRVARRTDWADRDDPAERLASPFSLAAE